MENEARKDYNSLQGRRAEVIRCCIVIWTHISREDLLKPLLRDPS